MSLSRRDLFKLSALGVASASLAPKVVAAKDAPNILKNSTKKHVVVVGGGFAGLTFAKHLRKNHKEVEITVLEKRDIFFSCPYSNLYLAGVEGTSLEELTYDYSSAAKKYAYELIQCEVTAIKKEQKKVFTTKGEITYDVLILAPGVAYSYSSQFPDFSLRQIQELEKYAPAGMIGINEHLAIKREFQNLAEGDVFITVPYGKYRCPPAPYERACLFADAIKRKALNSKVYILDTGSKPRAKAPAFMEAFKELYAGIIEYVPLTEIEGVDVHKKSITYRQYKDDFDEDGTVQTKTYALLNLIPEQKASPVIGMAKIKTNDWGGAKLNAPGYTSVSDENIYVLGDATGYPYPPSAQMANITASICATHVAKRLKGEKVNESKVLPSNVCYSIIAQEPHFGLMVSHSVSYTKEKGLKVKSALEKVGQKYRSVTIGQSVKPWLEGLKADIFL